MAFSWFLQCSKLLYRIGFQSLFLFHYSWVSPTYKTLCGGYYTGSCTPAQWISPLQCLPGLRNFRNFAPHRNPNISTENFGFFFVIFCEFGQILFKICQKFKKFHTKFFENFRNFGSITHLRQKCHFRNLKPWSLLSTCIRSIYFIYICINFYTHM